ncbi:cupin domain-containing protein [Microbacterium sp. cx-55]|uniref:cupin domain-containing protein n=1 Tax=unclassified Microbacterium TaxID=2609290 RepID=UPI001CBD146F|nr:MULTISPECIES: cupin domain-containing protein [unclassified Microbacterium]MBZ4487531.1 cupin domain-containing protein [Microbacterium sp. cx-55]MCC4908320.1 cupin domain-containing protein [Microbacterium sp. cx-59]UGB35551.1 cupin domain-containing protein [Microbacterium sp. cx-55]
MTPTIDRIDALDLVLPRTPIAPDQNAGGEPSVGTEALLTLPGTDAGLEVGVWEMGVGAMYDVEVDEVFVVIQGLAEVAVLDASGLIRSTLTLRPGVVCRLHAGTRTRWTVHRTLRKIYIVSGADA